MGQPPGAARRLPHRRPFSRPVLVPGCGPVPVPARGDPARPKSVIKDLACPLRGKRSGSPPRNESEGEGGLLWGGCRAAPGSRPTRDPFPDAFSFRDMGRCPVPAGGAPARRGIEFLHNPLAWPLRGERLGLALGNESKGEKEAFCGVGTGRSPAPTPQKALFPLAFSFRDVGRCPVPARGEPARTRIGYQEVNVVKY